MFHRKQKKLKIVNCCGFDCIPCDLGTQMVVQEAQCRGFTNIKEVRYLADKMKASASGGTLATVFNIFDTTPMKDLKKLLNPFFINPRDPATKEPAVPHDSAALYAAARDNTVMGYDSVTKNWTIPYMMQSIDTRIINRSNALSDYSYGRNFVFSERLIVPSFITAFFGSAAMTFFQLLIFLPFTRYFLKMVLPKPGEGPSQDMLDTGFFTARIWGKAINPTTGEEALIQGTVAAYQGDPGYR